MHRVLHANFFHVEPGKQDREREENTAEVAGKGLQHVGRLGAKKILRHAAAKRSAEAFIFRTLHEHQQNNEQRDENVDH